VDCWTHSPPQAQFAEGRKWGTSARALKHVLAQLAIRPRPRYTPISQRAAEHSEQPSPNWPSSAPPCNRPSIAVRKACAPSSTNLRADHLTANHTNARPTRSAGFIAQDEFESAHTTAAVAEDKFWAQHHPFAAAQPVCPPGGAEAAQATVRPGGPPATVQTGPFPRTFQVALTCRGGAHALQVTGSKLTNAMVTAPVMRQVRHNL